MGDLWDSFWKFAVACTSLVGALAWLTKAIVTHWLSKDLDAHKLKLEAQSALELERLRADLAAVVKEREIRFGTLHAKRASGLVDLFTALENAWGQASVIAFSMESRGEPNARLSSGALTELDAAVPLHRANLLYLDGDLTEKIDSYIHRVRSMELAEAPVAYWKEHGKALKERLSAIEADFRRLLGPELSPPSPTK